MKLTEFLLQRITEDEAAAREIPSGAWEDATSTTRRYDHVFRWSPDRVLAECEAKQRIVELHYLVESSDWRASARGEWKRDFPALRLGCNVCDEDDGWTKGTDGCVTLRALAAVYADLEDYDPTWRP